LQDEAHLEVFFAEFGWVLDRWGATMVPLANIRDAHRRMLRLEHRVVVALALSYYLSLSSV